MSAKWFGEVGGHCYAVRAPSGEVRVGFTLDSAVAKLQSATEYAIVEDIAFFDRGPIERARDWNPLPEGYP